MSNTLRTHRGPALWLRHFWSDRSDIRQALDEPALTRLETQVRTSESGHTGEIRLCVEASLPWRYLRQGASPKARALSMFAKLRVWDTEHNNGVLIYLLLADHAIEIVADRALYRLEPPEHWEALVTSMQPLLREGQHEAALQATITRVDGWLRRGFPLTGPRDINELPDRPVLR